VEIVLAALGAVLTLFIFSYLLDDNPLFRLALHIFVGVSVAYVCVVAVQRVILPVLTPPASTDSDGRLLWVISLIGVVFGLLLFARGIGGLSWLSGISLAILIGVGVGVTLAGAILGTLVPQVGAAANPTVSESPILPDVLDPVGTVVAILGTVTGLMVFAFIVRRPTRRLTNRVLAGGSRIGQWFVLIGFGAVYGGVLVASLSIFVDRVEYLGKVLEKIGGG
jgi:hypothetical protein